MLASILSLTVVNLFYCVTQLPKDAEIKKDMLGKSADYQVFNFF